MTLRGTRIAAVMLAAVSIVALAGAAGAQGTGEGNPQAALEARVREHDVQMDQRIEDLAAIGAELEDTQARMDGLRARASELRSQTRDMKRDLEIQRKTFEASKARYEEQARAAYKGDELEGLAILLRTFLGHGPSGSPSDIRVAGILMDGQENVQTYGDSRQSLSNTIRQLVQKRYAYDELVRQERAQAQNLHRQENKLDAAIARIRTDRNQAEARLQALKARERARILRARAATGGGSEPQDTVEAPAHSPVPHGIEGPRIGKVPLEGGPKGERTSALKQEDKPEVEAERQPEQERTEQERTEQERTEQERTFERERKIAEREIYVRPVENPPEASYWQLYQKAARDYGFARDWYILAAVGKIESDHGRSVGPSSSGAMGPMQFMPSTWEVVGVDGNGDGKANIMDPEDAIPAAAGYLRRGGAPGDWYAALYSYNHADWYVKEVLAVAEGYRRMANDDSVGPYI